MVIDDDPFSVSESWQSCTPPPSLITKQNPGRIWGLAGQNKCPEYLPHHTAILLAALHRWPSHFLAVDRQAMLEFLNHHFRISWLKNAPFTAQVVIAVHQRSGRLFSKANFLASSDLIATAVEISREISAEHGPSPTRNSSNHLNSTESSMKAEQTIHFLAELLKPNDNLRELVRE